MKTIKDIAKDQKVNPNTVLVWVLKAGVEPIYLGEAKGRKGALKVFDDEQVKKIVACRRKP
jgi:hypothetical protein